MAIWRGQLVGVLAVGGKRDQYADLAEARHHLAMHIGAHGALRHLERCRAAHRHVLADRRDHLLDVVFDRRLPARVGRGEQLCEIALRLGGERGDLRHHVLELLVARDEVGLGVHLDHRAGIARGVDADQTFGGDAPGLLGSLRQTLFAQPIDGGLDVALHLGERGLAVHHPGAGLLAQFLHQARGNRHG
jgi:hypothetical protein